MTDEQAGFVLASYPAHLRSGPPQALGNRGGFSGARLWRLGDWCLRAWPVAGPTRPRLDEIHLWMDVARSAGLAFVPEVARTTTGATCLEHAGRLWDLTAWLPGEADFHVRPSVTRMQAACRALATLHLAWAKLASAGTPPAIQRRLDLINDWQATASKARPTSVLREPLKSWIERAAKLVSHCLPGLAPRLLPWRQRNLPLQPCLADDWHEHVLFAGDNVTGIVDYGSARVDHVAADLARMLGSMARDEVALRQAGLAAYARLRPLSLEEEQLVTLLDETGTVLGLVNWLKWLLHDQRTFENADAVVQRIGELVERVENWTKMTG